MFAVGYQPEAPVTLTTEYTIPAKTAEAKSEPQVDSRTMGSMIDCINQVTTLMDKNDPKKETRIYTANGGVTIFKSGNTEFPIKYSCSTAKAR